PRAGPSHPKHNKNPSARHRRCITASSIVSFTVSENFQNCLSEERVEVVHGGISYHPAVDLVTVAGEHEIVSVLLSPFHLPGKTRILLLLLFTQVVYRLVESGFLDLPEVYATRKLRSRVVKVFSID